MRAKEQTQMKMSTGNPFCNTVPKVPIVCTTRYGTPFSSSTKEDPSKIYCTCVFSLFFCSTLASICILVLAITILESITFIMSTKRDPKKDISGAAKALQSIARPAVEFLTTLIPPLIHYSKLAYKYYEKLPQNALLFIYGFVFCFFGGTFPVLFAAIQAAEYTGRKAVMLALSDLANEAIVIIEESKKDDEKDEDNDGTKDVLQISNSEFLARKTKLVLAKMDPEKIDKAISSIYKVWLAVAAVLSIEFARTISMAMAISDFLKKPINHFIAPAVQIAVPDQYHKWVPVVLGWTAKAVAMTIAFTVQSVISGFASALKGGLMMAQALYQFLVAHDIKLGGLVTSPDHNESSLDEALSYVFAGLGFFVQFRSGFSLPFPLNVLLFPFQLAENWIRWSITKRS